jgi:hypothetical protein
MIDNSKVRSWLAVAMGAGALVDTKQVVEHGELGLEKLQYFNQATAVQPQSESFISTVLNGEDISTELAIQFFFDPISGFGFRSVH